jgi:actin-like protein 6A
LLTYIQPVAFAFAFVFVFAFYFLQLNNLKMFNSGDDIGAVVADVGSYGTRIGFAGEDSPRANFPTSIGRLLESEYLNSNQNISSGTLNHVQQNLVFNPTKYRNNMEITSPVRDGIVVDWDLLEKLWNYALSTSLKADLKGLPVLISEKPYASPTSRRRYDCSL